MGYLLHADVNSRRTITTVTTITPPVMIVMMMATVSLYCYARQEEVWMHGVMIRLVCISPLPAT